jgi:hypothetical protein
VQTLVELNLAGKGWTVRARGSITTLEETFHGSNSIVEINGNALQAEKIDHLIRAIIPKQTVDTSKCVL